MQAAVSRGFAAVGASADQRLSELGCHHVECGRACLLACLLAHLPTTLSSIAAAACGAGG